MDGLDGIIEFLQVIVDFITSVIDLVTMLVENLFLALSYIPSFVITLTESVLYLPSILGVFGTLFITLMVINYLLGRGSS